MEPSARFKQHRSRAAWVVLAALALAGLLFASPLLVFQGQAWWAQRTANERVTSFCGGVAIGSDISVAQRAAAEQGHKLGLAPDGHTYKYGYKAPVYEQAWCDLVVNGQGAVVSRTVTLIGQRRASR